MPVGIGMGVVGVAGAAIQAESAEDAANAASRGALAGAELEAQAQREALALQASIYGDQRGLAAPSSRAGAAAMARQMVMAGMSPAEAARYYNELVGALEAGFDPMPGNSEMSEAELMDAHPEAWSAWNGETGGGDIDAEARRSLRQQYGSFTNYIRATMGGDGLWRPRSEGALHDWAGEDLGDLSEWAPRTFSFGAEDLTDDPSYQWRLQQGMQGVERSQAARGHLFSGQTGMALQNYAQGLASTEFADAYGRAWNEFQTEEATRWNRLGALSGAGEGATAQLLNAGSQFGDDAADAIVGAGQAQNEGQNAAGRARASGYAAAGNAWGNFFNDTVPGALGYYAWGRG